MPAISNNDLRELETKFATNYKFETFSGVKYVGREFIELDKIYSNTESNHVVRHGGADLNLIEKLKTSFSRRIDTTEFLPIVSRLAVNKFDRTDGNLKIYNLVDGFNRINALKELGYTHYWFDVAEFDDEGSRLDFALGMNGHNPSKPAEADDIISTALRLIELGKIVKDFDKIRDWLNASGHTKSKSDAHRMATDICKTANIPNTYVVYTKSQLKDGLKHLNIESMGRYDSARGEHGWTCLEGYESDTVMNALAKYYDTGDNSYVVAHVKVENSNRNLTDRRTKMVKTFEEKKNQLIAACEFYNKYGTLPFELIGFLPQDTKTENMNEIISLK